MDENRVRTSHPFVVIAFDLSWTERKKAGFTTCTDLFSDGEISIVETILL
jgi:hypothetical protein